MTKKVYVLRGYRGARTNFEFLPKGEHVIEDDSLADYLIANRHAAEIEPPKPKPKPKVAKPSTAEQPESDSE